MAGRSKTLERNWMGKRFHHEVGRGWHLTQFVRCNSLFGAGFTSPPASKGIFFAEQRRSCLTAPRLWKVWFIASPWGKFLSFNTTSALITFCGGQELFPLSEFPRVHIWNGMEPASSTSHCQFCCFGGIKLVQPSFSSCFKVPDLANPSLLPCPQTDLFAHKV